MSMSQRTGMMAFWADIDTNYLNRYREWHNCEHMPERVAIPGFLAGTRYVDTSRSNAFLMTYETRDPAVLASDDYLTALNQPTAWTREALQNFQNPVRNIYVIQAFSGERARSTAPYLLAVRFNAANDIDSNKLTQNACHVSGVIGCRLGSVDEDVSSIQTSERKIYGGGPGEQRYLLLADIECRQSIELREDLDQQQKFSYELLKDVNDCQHVTTNFYYIDYQLDIEH